jgi:CRP-like cAMP-binding protein
MTTSTSDKVSSFFATCPVRAFDKRQLILRAGEPLPGVFYIVEGRVSQYDITPTGNEVVVNIFKPGAFFPMSNALNDTPNDYYFEASTAVQAKVTSVGKVVQFLEDNSDVALDLLKRVYRGVDGVLRRMAHLMGGDAKTRLIFEILNAAYRFGELQENGQLRVPLNEGDIARQSGLARETVSRLLHDLKVAKLMEVSRSGIVIDSISALESRLDANL